MRGAAGSGSGENPGVQGGPLMLDIGGDVGALIVYVPDSFAGTEIEISVAGGAPFTHTGVHPRGVGGRLNQTAVYPELAGGDYQLWHPTAGVLLGPVVHVDGGAVAELDLRELAAVAAPSPHPHPHAHTH